MRSFRMPIVGLMGIVLVCGLAFATIRSPTFQVVSVTFTVALTILLASIVGAIFGRYRAFWIGFAIFGWGYAILAFAPGAWEEIRPYLVTSHLINGLAHRGNHLQRIGHSIAAVVHGVVGGVLAVWLVNRARNRGGERGGE